MKDTKLTKIVLFISVFKPCFTKVIRQVDRCPSRAERLKLQEVHNCSNLYYHCLFDDVGLFKETCNDYIQIPHGNFPYYLTHSDRVSYEKCPNDRYQPWPVNSYEITECELLKSTCSGYGQVVCNNGSSTGDRSCGCDYINGYVPGGESSCCFPTDESTCYCLHRPCNETHELNADYKCVEKCPPGHFRPEGKNNCKKKPELPRSSSTKIYGISTSVNNSEEIRNSVQALICIVVTVLVFAMVYGIGYIFKKQYKKKALEYPHITVDNTSPDVTPGERVTLACRITSNLPLSRVLWWRKSKGEDVLLTTLDRCKDEIPQCPTHVIESVSSKDEGINWCEAKKCIGSSRSHNINLVLRDDEGFSALGKPISHPVEEVEKSTNEPLDVILMYMDSDQGKAQEFRRHLEGIVPDIKIRLIDEITLPGNIVLTVTNNLFSQGRYIFVLITEVFKFSMLQRYQAGKVLLESLMDTKKLSRVVPVTMAGPQHMPEELRPLVDIKYYHYLEAESKGKEDTIYIDTIKRLVDYGRKNYLLNTG